MLEAFENQTLENQTAAAVVFLLSLVAWVCLCFAPRDCCCCAQALGREKDGMHKMACRSMQCCVRK